MAGCSDINAFALRDRIVIGGVLAALTKNPTEIAFAIAQETAHIVLGDHTLGAVVFRPRPEAEIRADAFAAATIARAGHDPCLAAALLERMGQGIRAQLLRVDHCAPPA